jgi:hypothetical protein
MPNWPVVVTNACARRCADEFGIAEQGAKAWLSGLIVERGQITSQLPPPLHNRRSPSGQFLLVDGMLALTLAADREGRAQWIATNCLVLPEYRKQYGVAADVDPFALTGHDLLRHVHLSMHAVERFQERCGADPRPEVAAQQLVHALAPTVRASRRPPAWCRTSRQDFYLVAADEFCLPVSRQGSAGKAFEATTCMHRASDLFLLAGPDLAARVSVPAHFAETVGAAFARGAQLSWHAPPWAPAAPAGTRFWVHFTDRLAAALTWHPDEDSTPLALVSVAERRTLLDRIRSLFART